MAGLSAAYQLSRTAELREAYDVTVYTLGWRLGGKCATGRDRSGRIQEHGLHFWFGCYENAFRMLREVFDVWERPDGCPLRHWKDAIKPQSFTPIGVLEHGDPAYWPLTWPVFGGTPGDGGLIPSLMDMLETVLGVLQDIIHNHTELRDFVVGGKLQVPDSVAQAYDSAHRSGSSAAPKPLASSSSHWSLSGMASAARSWVRAFEGDVARFGREHHEGILWLLGAIGDHAVAAPSDKPTTHLSKELLNIGASFAKGVVHDVILDGKTHEQLCDMEFRQWLLSHGGHPDVIHSSTVLRAFYDTVMQYEDGDPTRPSMAASAAIVTLLRLLCTTKGAMMWELQAGMGEVIVAPIYQVLLQNGVHFKFFRRVDRLELSTDKRLVQRIRLARQVDLKGDDYQPTITINGLVCWPSEPLWDQIVDGERLREAGADLESHWCNQPPAGVEVLDLGSDFDQVVLAISMGVFKRLNSEAGLADELIAANRAFRAMTEKIGLIPTMATQIWCGPDLTALGWEAQKPASVGGPEPLSVWSDMSQSLKFEPWQAGSRPGSVQYFCGVYATKLYARPSSEREVPEIASNEVRSTALQWLERFARDFLPKTTGPDGKIDWGFLFASRDAKGITRFDEQYRRANIDPTECCPGSFAGSTRYRLKADGSGFDNLCLAGCWVLTGLDTTCVESAVMAGMQASRAICGSPKEVWGEKLLRS
jgi:uncharacterized protein with NAD-binding domain and iron-sulfur cluster